MNLQGLNLSIDLFGQDVKLLQSDLQQLGLQIADGEIQKSAFGQDTLDSVCNSRNEMGLQANVT